MLTEKLEQAIVEQINFELYSANVYLAMANYCASEGYAGCESWFMVQYEEELFHAKKFMKFVNEKGGRVIIDAMDTVDNEYGSILEVFEQSLHHEQEVTSRIYNLMDIAVEEREHATRSFLNWFVDEQVEEEDAVRSIIDKINLVKDAGMYLLDQELGQRTFTAPPL
jgi:ferritin